ncbi:MAG TPA: aminotransferase class IV [Thermoanaerobaculia bacterium]
MNDVLWFNGRFTTTEERVLRVEDRGFLFGDAVYEVFKFFDRGPVFFREHWQRLVRGLDAIEIANPWDESSFTETMRGLIERTAFDDGIVYIEVSRGDGERSHTWPDGMKPTAIAFSRRHTFPDATKKERGIRLVTEEDVRWRHCDVKSVNLLANILAKQKAQRAGGDEALLVDDGVVRECSHSSFFIVKDERVITHPLDCHVLPGVTRDRVIALAGDRIEERYFGLAEVAGADEVFATSTSLAVMPVRQIDDGPWRTRGSITLELQRLLDDAERVSAHRL